MKLAITHAGQAHADEFIALAIMIAKGDVAQIERRDPTPAELSDPAIWVVDVGGSHDPDVHNFDHHGVAGTEGRCAFDLVLAHYGLGEVAAAASPWLAFKSALDCGGPFATARTFGMTPEALFATLSPIESQALQLFGKASAISAGEFLFELLKVVGDGLLAYWELFASQLAAAEGAVLLEVKGLIFVDYRDCGEITAAVMNRHMTRLGAAGSVTADDRGPGHETRVVLYRHADNSRVDFGRLDATQMHFVHHNGFLAKTANGDTSPERIRELLAAAVE